MSRPLWDLCATIAVSALAIVMGGVGVSSVIALQSDPTPAVVAVFYGLIMVGCGLLIGLGLLLLASACAAFTHDRRLHRRP